MLENIKRVTRDAAEAAWDSYNEQRNDAEKSPYSVEDLQTSLLRFEGRFGDKVRKAFYDLEHSQDSGIRSKAFHLRLGYTSSALEIAVSSRPDIALIDMIALVVLGKKTLFDQGDKVVEAFSDLEKDIWDIALDYLNDEQRLLLARVIEDWYQENNKNSFDGVSVRLSGIVRSLKVQQLSLDVDEPRFTFFASMDQALSTADKSRMLGERVFYYIQRSPFFLRWHLKATVQDVFDEIHEQVNPESLKKLKRILVASGVSIVCTQVSLRLGFKYLDLYLAQRYKRPLISLK